MYEPKKFDHLLGTPGFSDELLKNHFALYEGYVKNTNLLIDLLTTKEPNTPAYAELQRRFGWEFNGMRLHELYFGNMTTVSRVPEGTIKDKLSSIYGSIEEWKKNFMAVGAMRGIGWTILSFDKQNGELFNIWINEHDGGYLAGTTPLLVMDVFEHAFMLDYGLKRADYMEAFFKAIDWQEVEKRYASS
ncbi:superoxide dismutase [Candidatus Uhrbacteria bacterium]|nr:superoxide dismutase [Candidatus Uhrbacteria bacterium]